ncbi:G-protein coupled receptor GRL101-like [Patiria miniata]|uniref:G-protein coupled receptors family 1 profile domain-containing protein n=1 Tax=Patiria miniata TaxID=46514 RepID=A0A914A8C3_PATMI|nr:G-protein coupled receptor GRL101-like [Patiria miniata]
MRIVDFAMEERYDFLYVTRLPKSGVGSTSPGIRWRVVFGLTGEDIGQRTMVWSENVWLTMMTDNSKEFRGFSIVIERLNVTDLGDLCQSGEFHCGNGFCISQTAICDGYLDCLNYRDEANCSEIVCPGSYKCDNVDTPATVPNSQPTSPAYTQPLTTPNLLHTYWPTTYQPTTQTADHGYVQAQCIPRALVCNGAQDCPNLDDETDCDKKRCPTGCDCHYSPDGHFVVSCANGWNATTLSNIAATTYTLHLSGVDISLEGGIFKELKNLKVLSLKNNKINEIPRHTFDGLTSLVWLDLSNTSLTELQTLAMEELSGLQGITIFDVPLKRIQANAFTGLGNVETLILVRNDGNLPPLEVEDLAFEGLENVSLLFVDNHRMCCFFPENVECKTLKPEPVLFMCGELMPRVVLKVFMWILGVSALVGNIFVMMWRCREKTEGKASRIVQSFLVFNLAVSDALMGLYMLIIAGADVYFGKRYFELSDEWRASVPCRIASMISIVASEASVFFLTFISIDRFVAIVFPFSTHRVRPKKARIIAGCIWIGTSVIALVPTILATDEQSDIYGLSDVCIGLPLRTKVTEYEIREHTVEARGMSDLTVGIPVPAGTRPSWFFSIVLFLGVNLLCFCVIMACYIAIFVNVSRSVKKVRRHKGQDDEVRMAIKMAAIVSTDFICWIPVIITGILAQARVVEIPTEAYAWIVVFVLPINSSLNPYLYTISDLCTRKRQEAASKRKIKRTIVDASNVTIESVVQ